MNGVLDSVVSRVVLGVIRHAVGAWGASLVGQGLLTKDQDNQLIGAIMVIVPIAFSVWDKVQSKGVKK